MQKVVSVTMKPDKKLLKQHRYYELEFDQLNAYLDQGYKVVKIKQIRDHMDLFDYPNTYIFVLERE